jgi:hypothetical protein
VYVKEHNASRHGLRGSYHEKRSNTKISTNRAKTITGENLLERRIYILSLYPKISAIASGATPIGSAGRAPDKKESTEKKKKFESMIGYKYPSIASGATYIRSTGCAPNDNGPIWRQLI